MNLQGLGRKLIESPVKRPLLWAVTRALYRDRIRRTLFWLVDLWLQRVNRQKKAVTGSAGRIQRERVLLAGAVLRTVDRMIERRQISPRLMGVGVMPCVFTPYAVADIHEVYARGETLNDVWRSPFLRAIRDWQREYGYAGGPVPTRAGNWMRPCPIRDHYPLFRKWLGEHRPEPQDETADILSHSDAYLEGMTAYGEEVRRLTETLWNEVYLGQDGAMASRKNPSRA